MAAPGSRVFVGNLSYNTTEEALYEAFRTVGPVVSARLVCDRETRAPKGFGFVEFHDAETASSAVRNLNGYEIEGRGIRVDMAEPEKGGAGRRPPPVPPNSNRPPPMAAPKGGLPPNLPSGIPVPPGMTATDSITQTLATMPPDQLLDILSQMKSLVTTSPEQARNLLNAHPSLSYALFQAMVLMKVVDPAILQRMLAPALGAPAPPVHQSYPPAPANYYGHAPPAPPNPYQSAMPQQAAYPPQQQVMQPPPAAPAPGLNPQAQAQLLQQVMAMSQSQIDALPPKDRETVMALRRSLNMA